MHHASPLAAPSSSMNFAVMVGLPRVSALIVRVSVLSLANLMVYADSR